MRFAQGHAGIHANAARLYGGATEVNGIGGAANPVSGAGHGGLTDGGHGLDAARAAHCGGQLGRAKHAAARRVNRQNQAVDATVGHSSLHLAREQLRAGATANLRKKVGLGGDGAVNTEHGNAAIAHHVLLGFVG